MINKPKECNECLLQTQGKGFVGFEGSGTNGVVIIGDVPGDSEVQEGLPMRSYSENGSALERAINRSPGLKRSEFKIGSIIQCMPPWGKLSGTSYGFGALEQCKIHRDKLINSIPQSSNNYKQRVILALGHIPFRVMSGLEGDYLGLDAIRGYPIQTDQGLVIGSYSPKDIVKGSQKLMGVLMLDIRKAVHLAKNGFKQKPLNYQENPSIIDCANFLQRCKDNINLPLAFDIETPNVNEDGSMPNQIFSIQFSLGVQEGIFFNWMGLEMEIAKEILALPNNKLVYNGWRFDVPMLQSVGQAPVNGRIDDLIWCLAGDTQLKKWDGTRIKIKEVVNNKLPTILEGMDENGQSIPVEVIKWHKQFTENQKWLHIKSSNGRFPIYCTPDHEIWANNKWIRAENVKAGDIIRVPGKGSPDLIHGTMLGDGHITKQGTLALRHSAKQKDWILAKAGHLGLDLKWTKGSVKSKGGEYYTTTQVGQQWKRLFYPNNTNKKVFVAPISNAALAVWYCDDGSYVKWTHTHKINKRFNVNRGYELGGGTVTFAIGDVANPEEVLAWFKQNIGKDISLNGKMNNRNIHIKKASRDKFFELISEYTPLCMDYKLPDQHKGKYNGWLEENITRTGVVESIKEELDQRITSSDRYCVTVNHPTNRFFTLGGLVHNCFHHFQPDITTEKKEGEDASISSRMGLQYVASFFDMDFHWKYMKKFKELQKHYGIADVDALQRIWSSLPDQMRKLGVWSGYDKLRYELEPVLINMSLRGIPVDNEARSELRTIIQEDKEKNFDKMQELVPVELRNVQPKGGYKKGWSGVKVKEGKVRVSEG